jgi:WD40 repeat protein
MTNLRNPGSEDQNLRGVNLKNIIQVAISPNADLIAAAYDDHTIHIWDTATRDEIASLYGHNDTITGLQFTPDGKLLISTSVDHE